MHDQKLPRAPDVLAAAVTFLGINMMWIFFVIWMLYGMVPVLVMAVLVNHFITRLEQRLN
ncbi:histidinol phosphate aminotransferase [Rhodobacterales bacterium 56_14_T64]|nr:histidinol phosphate aminotransferase [Rhodobacterales bacterium 56_14_T64]